MNSLITPDTSPIPSRRLSGVVLVLAGLLAGAALGVVARGWMRFISAEHEFSWSGTLMIIGIFAFCGMGQALAAAALRGGWPRPARIGAQTVALASALPLGLAAGAPMLPPTLLAGVALGRTRMDRRWRFALVALAIVPTLMVLRQLIDELPLWRALVGWALMFAIYLPIVWALSRTFGAFGLPAGRNARRERVMLMVGGAIVVVGMLVALVLGGIQ